ncbi:MAG: MurR/RpiR family transcriptional regulator [Pseudomonadota bacterium]
MNEINVPNREIPEPTAVLEELTKNLESLSPELRKAAAYVLENRQDVGISSIREIADAAGVKPNTFMRMAREIGFDGYDDFREPFREEIRKGTASFPDRARWLQSIRQGGGLGELYADMVASTLENIETTFAGIDEKTLKSAAEMIWKSRQVFTLGVGVNSANAQNFTYLASTGMVQFHAIPATGSTATDDLAWADERDVLIAITCKPYRREVVEAIKIAREQGLKIIGISDSPASPVILGADIGFVIAANTPQFFPSSVTTIALLETLLSFVIASATPEIVDRVDKFHKRRHELGIYQEDL